MRTLISTTALLVAATTTARADNPSPPPPPAATTTAAPAAAWQLGIAPRLGVVVPTSKLGPMMVGGLELDYAVSGHLVIALDGTITQPSYDGSVMDTRIPGGTATYTIKETELSTALMIDYRLAGPDASLVPWLGIGPMLHMLRSNETNTIAPGTNTAQSTEFGVELGGGVDFKAGPGYLAGDLRFAYSKLDHTLTGSTNAGKVTIGIGYRVVF